jgi:hypothetical protein
VGLFQLVQELVDLILSAEEEGIFVSAEGAQTRVGMP